MLPAGGFRNLLGLAAILFFGAIAAVAFVLLDDRVRSPQGPPGSAIPGEPWDGKGKGGISQSEADSFDDYSLFWLGPEYGGLNLQSIVLNSPATPGVDEVYFVYGSCVLSDGPGRRSCAAPGHMYVRPLCSVLPKDVAFGAGEPVRGGGIVVYNPTPGGSGLVWTGDVVIGFGFTDASLHRAAIAHMHTLNDVGPAIGPGEPLPAPRFEICEGLPPTPLPMRPR